MFSSRRYEEGEILFRQGQPGVSAHIIKSGKIEVYLENGNKEQQLAVFGAGQIFGEMALLGGGKDATRTASCRSLTRTEVINLSRAHLLTMFKGVDPILKHLVLTLVNRLKSMNDKIQPGRTDHICESFCRVLTLAAKADMGTELASIFYDEVLDSAAMILALDASDCAFILEQLKNRFVIRIEGEEGSKRQIMFNPKEFTARLTNVAGEIDELIEKRLVQRSVLMDIVDLTEAVGLEKTQVLNKISGGEFPSELLTFKKEDLELWLAKVGPEFFTAKAKKKVITSADEIESFTDLSFLKGAVLKQILTNEEIGVFQWISLIKHEETDEGFEKRILSGLPPRIGKEVKNELDQLDDSFEVDEVEFEELEEMFVDLAKEILEQSEQQTGASTEG